MLQTLLGILDKAEQQLPDQAQALLSARLAADMYPLASQLRFAAYQAQEAVFRLLGRPISASLEAVAAEGRNADEAPGSLVDARARIDTALTLLKGLAGDALDSGASMQIAIELPGGLAFDLSGEQYARDWALPQFYFHVITAYAILRSSGVEIGKADYVPHMFVYVRPGAATA